MAFRAEPGGSAPSYAVRVIRPGIVVVDVDGGDEPETVARTVADSKAAGSSVVVVIPEPTAETIRTLLVAGADAVVHASTVDAQLGPALDAVSVGLVAVPREAREAVEGPALTRREKEVLGMVVLGFSNADIARTLFLAESTVKSHLSSAFGKLGVRTRSEATAAILDRSRGLGTGILAIVGDGDAGIA